MGRVREVNSTTSNIRRSDSVSPKLICEIFAKRKFTGTVSRDIRLFYLCFLFSLTCVLACVFNSNILKIWKWKIWISNFVNFVEFFKQKNRSWNHVTVHCPFRTEKFRQVDNFQNILDAKSSSGISGKYQQKSVLCLVIVKVSIQVFSQTDYWSPEIRILCVRNRFLLS